MPPPGQQQQNNGGAGAGLMTGILVLLMVLIWFIAHDPIARGVLTVLNVLNIPWSWLPAGQEISEWIQAARQSIKVVTFKMLVTVANEIGKPYRWLLFPMMGWVVYDAMRTPSERARSEHSMQTLMEVQSHRWKAIVPFLRRNLMEVFKGRLTPSLSAPEYSRRYKLVKAERQLDVVAARKQFIAELGPPWKGAKNMTPAQQALFTVFGVRILRIGKSKHAQELLDRLNESARKHGRVQPEVVQEDFVRLLATLSGDKKNGFPAAPRNLRRLRTVLGRHKYAKTMLVGLLVEARNFDGILPPAQFLWFKEMDRSGFYALNRAPVAGRMSFTSFAEGSGILAQFQSEMVAASLGRRLTVPYVDSAVKGFKIDLYQTGVTDEEEVE